jgi:hypothetical protein
LIGVVNIPAHRVTNLRHAHADEPYSPTRSRLHGR